jgi:ABC-2 type transport system permease protein
MAGLTQIPPPPEAAPVPALFPVQPWTSAQSRAQFAALAQLRWCIFRNGFRRKGGVGELIARILFLPLLGVIAIFPILGAGFGAYYLVQSGKLTMLPALTWGIFLLWQLVSINIAAPSLSFDINTIIRFPLSLQRYLAARLFFGLLSAANVIGTLALIAAAIGIAIARPSLALWSALLLATFALANIFFTRMAFAWVDRWLSTRRARELFTAFIIFGSLGFQYLNVTFNPGLQNGRHPHPSHLPFFLKIFHRIEPLAALLPPGLTASSIASYSHGHLLAAAAFLIGLILFGALFFAIYTWRMQKEFRGENLSELTLPKQTSPNLTSEARSQATPAVHPAPTPNASQLSTPSSGTFGLSPTLSACLQKEFIYLRRNTNQLYGFLAPIFMVFLFASRMGASGRAGALVFPLAVAYSILGVSILSYNCLGMDGSGIQLYFLTPTSLRDVFLAKNLIGFALNLIELLLIFVVICFVAHPPSPVIALATLCWLLFATFTNGAVGNLRSLIAPKKIDLSKVSRKQTSQLSALIALAVILACVGIGFAVVVLANSLHHPWLMIPIFLVLATAAFVFYLQVLNRLDAIALDHREDLAEELCKA